MIKIKYPKMVNEREDICYDSNISLTYLSASQSE